MTNQVESYTDDDIGEPGSFLRFARERWGVNWAICRATARNRERYGKCISHAEYQRGRDAWMDEGWAKLSPDLHELYDRRQKV